MSVLSDICVVDSFQTGRASSPGGYFPPSSPYWSDFLGKVRVLALAKVGMRAWRRPTRPVSIGPLTPNVHIRMPHDHSMVLTAS